MVTSLLNLLALIASGYALLCLLLFWRQENAIFYPVHNDVHLREDFRERLVTIPVDGATLEGWRVDVPEAANDDVILYFGGNAEDVLYTASRASAFGARRLLAMNYRGYGRSTGQPGQAALYADALAIYDYAIRSGERPEKIVVVGRSLGSAVATMLAANRPVAAAILITPFDSLGAVAAGHYPLFPVRLLLRHPFPSNEWAANATAPALFLAAGRDTIVPAQHAHRLAAAWKGRKEFHLLPDADHNDIDGQPGFYPLIREFLASLPD